MRIRFAVLALLLSALSAPAFADNDTIKLGLSGPYSGEVATLGEDIKTGAQQAVDDINAKGGVLGRKLEPLFEDDACDPKTGVTVANHFLTEKVAMVAAACSRVCMAVAPIYAEENIPFLTECNTDDFTSHGWTNVIRAYLRNAQEAPKLVDLIAQKQQGKKLAILHFNEAYNRGLAEDIVKLLAARHITPDAVLEISDKSEDFTAVITQLKDQKIGVVYLGLWPKALGLFLRQAASAGYHPLFISNEVAAVDDVHKIAGAAIEGLIFANSPFPQSTPSSAPMLKELAAKNVGDRPFALYSYMLVQVYADAVRKAGSTDSAKVLHALKTEKFDTIFGPVSFTDKGDMTGIDFVYAQWRGGKMVPLETK